MEHCFFPASTVRHAEVDGLRIILDLKTENYRILDDAASLLWSVLIGEADATTSLADLAQRYDVDEDRLQVDLTTFADRCLAEGLLVRSQSPAPSIPFTTRLPPARGRPASTLGALICLMATRRALARYGFRVTYDRYALLPIGPEAIPLDRALSTFTRAENFFISSRAPGDCLVRSLSLYRFLRRGNIPAEHVIGVRRFAFNAHAWVEYKGLPVLDDRAQRFTPLARIGKPPDLRVGRQ
jgi:hypothetical protein